MSEQECYTCDKVHNADWQPRHPFNDGSLHGAKQALGVKQQGKVTPIHPEVSPISQSWPFDPVLRQALVDKGIITPEDLHNAEDKIRTVTATLTGS